MRPGFVAAMSLLGVVLVTAPSLVLLVVADADGPALVWALAGLPLVGLGATLRPVLVATAPSGDPDQGRVVRRLVPAGAIALGLALLAVGLAPSGVATAAVVVLAYAALLVALTRLTDRWALRVARETPADVPRAGDDAALSAVGLRRRLTRVAALAAVVGVTASVVVVILQGVTGGDLVDAAVSGLAALVWFAAMTVFVGVVGPTFAASRRVNAVAHQWSGASWRISWALLRGRADRLPAPERALAPAWARAALPGMLLQSVGQCALMVALVTNQAWPIALGDTSRGRIGLTLALLALAAVGIALVIRQYVATRRFSLANPVPEPPDEGLAR